MVRAHSDGPAGADAVGLLAVAGRPVMIGRAPAALARRLVGPADGWTRGVVGSGDDGRRTRAVVVLVGVDADGSRGHRQARVAGILRWFAGWHVMVGEERRQAVEHHGG